MIRVGLREAKGNLEHLLDEAAAGEEIVIEGHTGAQIRLVPLSEGNNRDTTGASKNGTIGTALDRFIGSWSADQEAELGQAIEIFDRVDDSFWA